MPFASGAFRSLAINEEVTFGTLVAAGATYINRVSATPDLTKDVYRSNAIRTDQQIAVSRHGMRKIGGPINCELNPGEYKRIIQAILRKDFVAGATTGSGIVYSTVSGTSFVRSSGSFLTNGFKIGSAIQSTGFTTSATNLRRFLVTSVSATVLGVVNMDGSAATLATEAAGATVTISEVGKYTLVPSTGHTDKSFSIESLYADLTPTQSEVLTGSKFVSADIKLPTTGLSTVDFSVLGKDLLRNTTQQFTTPSSPATAPGLASVNGVVLIQGVPVGILNNLDLKLDGQGSVDGVVGSNTTPFVWMGPILGSGNFTAFFQDAALRDYFIDETEVGLIAVFTTSNAAAPDFMAFRMPRCKVNGATKDDKQTGGIKLTGTLELLRNTAGGAGTASDDTTIAIQDSLA